jgi:cysteine synthase A
VHLAKFHPSVYAKLEYFNPTGSIKDRVARTLLDDAERRGCLIPGRSTIIDATSGNFGLSMGALGAERGYRVVMCIPEDRSVGKRTLMRHYGVTVVLTPREQVMRGSIETAQAIAQASPHVFYTQQFSSPLNVLTHELETGPEIWRDMEQAVDAAVLVAGSGATYCGVTKALKRLHPKVRTFLAQPEGSVFARPGKTPSPWKVEGVGSTFEPAVFDRSLVVEEPLDIPDTLTIECQQEIFSKYPHISVSPCGALGAAAARLVALRHPELKRIVTIFTEEVTRSMGRITAPLAQEVSGSARELPNLPISRP